MKAGFWLSIVVLGIGLALCVGGCKNPFKKEEPKLDRPVGAKAITAPEPPPSYTAAPVEAAPAPAPAISTSPMQGGYTGTLPTTYTVKRGDTLWSIAKYHYGDGKAWQRIAETNGVQGTGIKVGMKLTIP
ncbi:MAG: LysM peptidoglycan-binding domain-containing protein [Planctomycetota bacterium]